MTYTRLVPLFARAPVRGDGFVIHKTERRLIASLPAKESKETSCDSLAGCRAIVQEEEYKRITLVGCNKNCLLM